MFIVTNGARILTPLGVKCISGNLNGTPNAFD